MYPCFYIIDKESRHPWSRFPTSVMGSLQPDLAREEILSSLPSMPKNVYICHCSYVLHENVPSSGRLSNNCCLGLLQDWAVSVLHTVDDRLLTLHMLFNILLSTLYYLCLFQSLPSVHRKDFPCPWWFFVLFSELLLKYLFLKWGDKCNTQYSRWSHIIYFSKGTIQFCALLTALFFVHPDFAEFFLTTLPTEHRSWLSHLQWCPGPL